MKKKTVAKKKSATNGSAEHATENNILKIMQIEKSQRAERSFGERLSEWIALFCGSMIFVYVHIAWFGGWVIYNSVLRIAPFDPFPYTFLTLVVSLEAIFLSTFILISQNHDTLLAERRNQFDLQINLLAEQENTKMLELLGRIAEKVGVDFEDEALRELLKPIEPEMVVKQILEAEESDTTPKKGGASK